MRREDRPRLVVVAGSTATAGIEGISAAGADADAMRHTPAADLEILAYGRPTGAPVVPVSPTGCPTPAIVTRAVRELLDLPLVAVDAGIARSTYAPTVDLGGRPGRDVREPPAVPDARKVFDAGREFGASLADSELLVGETVPGGTTTALGVLTALGHRPRVSSSLPDNPIELKREVVARGLEAAAVQPPVDDPIAAIHAVGDPVLAGLAGILVGATETGTPVTLAGGTQLVAAAALARAAGVSRRLALATTTYIAADDGAGLSAHAAELDLDLTVTDPGFGAVDHPAAEAYVAGEAKEGVGMGGALAVAERAEIPMARVHERVVALTDRLLSDRREAEA